MLKRFGASLTAVMVGWALAGGAAWAATGAVSGKVVDESGNALPGVMVTAFDYSTDATITVHTQEDGTYTIDGLDPKSYELRARLIGLEDEYIDEVDVESGKIAGDQLFKMQKTDDVHLQRRGDSLFSIMKWEDPKDKRNFKMMCGYCHQIGTIGFRSPEEPVDWETMVTRMDGFGGLYEHTKETIVDRLLTAYSPEAEEEWEAYTPPPAPSGKALNAVVREWDMGRQDACMIHDLELGTDGLVYIVDMINDAVMSVDPDTGDREVYPVPGGKDPSTDATPVKGPHSIEADADGNMWITLALSGEMAKFDTKTKEWTQVSGFPGRPRGGYPHTLRIDKKGTVWYTDAAIGVFALDPETMEITRYQLPSADQAVGAGRGESRGVTPYGISVSPKDGTIWYSKLNGNRIGRIDPNVEGGDVKEWNPPFRGPRRLHVAADGKVWVPGFGSGVFASFDPDTAEWDVIELPDHDNQIPYALNINPVNGDVWICGTGQDTMVRYIPETKEMITYRMPSRVTYTREVEFDAEGNVWVCNSNYPARHIERGRGSVIKIAVND